MSSTRKLNVISENKDFEKFRLNFRKKIHFAYFFFVIHGKIMVGIASGSIQHSLHTNMIFASFLVLNF